MRHLFKIGCGALHPNTSHPNTSLRLIHRYHIPKIIQIVCRSIMSKNPSNTNLQNSQKEKTIQNLGPLFDEILDIVGTENVYVDKGDPYWVLIPKETESKESVMTSELSATVCENVKDTLNSELSAISATKENVVIDGGELRDVSPIVHKITAIVRGETDMEEMLEKAGFEYSEEIVENVLKRCFKVPQLALRFFNWLQVGGRFGHTTETFNTMIHVAGKLNLVEKLVEEMEKSSCKKNIKTWTLLVSHYGKAKLIGKSVLVFEKMKEIGFQPDAIAYKILLHALCNAKRSDLALEFYKEMTNKDIVMDVRLYKELLKCFAMTGDVASAHLVGDNMVSTSEIPKSSVYSLMLNSFCIAGRIREALELIRDMKNKNINLDPENFETLVKGLCSTDRISDAMEVVEIMKRRNVFDPRMYEAVINAFLRRNEVCEAFEVFQKIKDSGDVSISIYTNLMQQLFRKSEFQKCIELYIEMVEKGIQMDSGDITSVFEGVKQNNISEVWSVIINMDEIGVKAASGAYKMFVNELCRISKKDELVKVLNEIQTCKMNNQTDVIKQIQFHLEETGNVENSKAISLPRVEMADVDPLQPIGKSDSIRSEILEVQQILSSFSDWFFIQQKLEKCTFQFSPDLVEEILCTCKQNGGNVLKFFLWVGNQPGYRHSSQSYNMAMKIAGQGKDFTHMRSLFNEMRRRGCSISSDTWTIMIMQYGRTGLTDIALSKFKEMKLSGCKPTKSTYKSLITSLCGKKGRKVDEAIRIYQEMNRIGCVPDKELVETYMGCLCEMNKLADARSCIDLLQKFGFSTPLVYSLYIRALCRADKLEEALALLDEVGNEKNLLAQYTYGSLIHGFLRKGRLEDALQRIKSMKEVNIFPTVHVYTALIVYYFKQKEISKALGVFEEMKEYCCKPTIVTYSALICGYVRMERVKEAWDLFDHIKINGPSPDFKTYSMFVDCLCKIGKSEEALKLLDDMLDARIIPSTINFRNIIFGLNREGKPDLAKAVLKKKLDIKQRRKMHLDV